MVDKEWERPCAHLVCAVRWARSGKAPQDYKCTIEYPMVLDLSKIPHSLAKIPDETLYALQIEIVRELNSRLFRKDHPK